MAISMTEMTISATAPRIFSATSGWKSPTGFTSLRDGDLVAGPGAAVPPDPAGAGDWSLPDLGPQIPQFPAPFVDGQLGVLAAFLW